MALSLAQRVGQLDASIDGYSKSVNIGVQFFEVVEAGAIDERGRPVTRRTGECSPIYGGKYSGRRRVGDCDPEFVHEVECSTVQLALVLDDHPVVEASGGRGGGKSEGGVCKTLRAIVERPHDAGQVVSPTFDLTRVVWSKLLRAIPGRWLSKIRRAERVLEFVNGAWVRFRSADNPDSLRSWGGGWTFLDEEQDVSTEAVDIVWPSLRESARPQMWGCGTPKSGDYLDRHQKRLLDPHAHCFTFDSYSNPFISKAAFDESRRQMSVKQYRQEIGADWSVVLEDLGLVYSTFSRARHCVRLPFDIGRDVTLQTTHERTQCARQYVGSIDYNWSCPNICIVWKVYAPNRWVVVDIVEANEHAGHLASALHYNGYHPEDILLIDDASGEIKNGPNAQNSSTRLMRKAGYTVMHPRRNPSLKDSVNAVLAKLSPAAGDPSLFLALPAAERLATAMSRLRWDGDVFDRDCEDVHWCDAMRYAISYFCPAARIDWAVQPISMVN